MSNFIPGFQILQMHQVMRQLIFCCFFLFAFLMLSGQSTIDFSGFKWNVRNGTGGPGPNKWSDDPSSVWVDTLGYLHLRIRKSGDSWYCSEVYTQQSLGYAAYRFDLVSDPELYDPNIVVGLFTYENDSREIDIEFAKWGNPQGLASWYTVQPAPYTPENHYGFMMGLQGRPSSHSFRWTNDSIIFRSSTPYTLTLPPTDSILAEWAYTGSSIPPPGNERLHLNFWLFQGKAPTNGESAEIIIRSVNVDRTQSLPENEQLCCVSIFPNPASQSVKINIEPVVPAAHIKLYDLRGKILLEKNWRENEQTLELKGLSAGMFFLQIETSSASLIEKILVMP